ncbi:DUF421 domain-containing protein [Metabacillus sp. RGM 3146]|uniref:DUF421 domain-containing protein n=1 Tax=Metabacillus sp. RGM 3146 TaxID=3401092 RepID=UPI003B9BA54A
MEILWNSLLIFVFGYTFLRLTGKKAVSQMHSFDLLFIIVVSNVISQPVQLKNVWLALFATLIFVVLYKLFMYISLNNKLRWVLYESPTVLIRNGDIDRKGLRKVRIPVDELLAQLRVKGYTDTKNIAIACLEDSGQISVIPKSDYRPVQPKDLKLKIKREYIPIPVVMDGQILDHNLKYLKLDRQWLMKKLKRKGEELDKIILATITEAGDVSVDNNNVHNGGKDPYSYKPGEDN